VLVASVAAPTTAPFKKLRRSTAGPLALAAIAYAFPTVPISAAVPIASGLRIVLSLYQSISGHFEYFQEITK
jgi:MFS superfamily sulfate permease-like transporter